MFFKRNQESELEARLRHDRPEPDSGLVQSIASRIDGGRVVPARPRSLRIAFAVASVGVLAALASFGGVSYAASGVTHAAVAVKHVFVAKNVKGESKQNDPFSTIDALQPSKTSAGDQYGPFLPPGTTPLDAANAFARYVVGANQDLQDSLGCSSLHGAALRACLAKQKALKALLDAENAQLNAIVGKLPGLSVEKQNQVGTLLAIHIQQQQKLAANQATRRANCANAAYKAAHKAICRKANPASEARERLRLGTLQLAELNALLAALGA